MKKSFTTFTFWRNGKVEFKISEEEIEMQFYSWLPTKEISWLKHYGSQTATRVFITERLSAIGREAEFPALHEITKQIFNKSVSYGTVGKKETVSKS